MARKRPTIANNRASGRKHTHTLMHVKSEHELAAAEYAETQEMPVAALMAFVKKRQMGNHLMVPNWIPAPQHEKLA